MASSSVPFDGGERESPEPARRRACRTFTSASWSTRKSMTRVPVPGVGTARRPRATPRGRPRAASAAARSRSASTKPKSSSTTGRSSFVTARISSAQARAASARRASCARRSRGRGAGVSGARDRARRRARRTDVPCGRGSRPRGGCARPPRRGSAAAGAPGGAATGRRARSRQQAALERDEEEIEDAEGEIAGGRRDPGAATKSAAESAAFTRTTRASPPCRSASRSRAWSDRRTGRARCRARPSRRR